MSDIVISIEDGEKLKLRPPIPSGEAYEILQVDPRAGPGTLSDKNDYLLPPDQALIQAADESFVPRRQGAGVQRKRPHLCSTIPVACRPSCATLGPSALFSAVLCSQGT